MVRLGPPLHAGNWRPLGTPPGQLVTQAQLNQRHTQFNTAHKPTTCQITVPTQRAAKLQELREKYQEMQEQRVRMRQLYGTTREVGPSAQVLMGIGLDILGPSPPPPPLVDEEEDVPAGGV